MDWLSQCLYIIAELILFMRKEDLVKMSQEEHQAYHRRIVYVFIILMIVLFGGATFYHYVENWRYLDAVYFSAYTITTVGYGDFTPKTDVGKIFTIFYVFAGVSIALYGLSLLVSHLVEVREEFWHRRLQRMRLKHHTKTIWEKLKDLFNYNRSELAGEYKKEVKKNP